MTQVRFEIRDQVAEILFDNPPVNALSESMLDDYLARLQSAADDPAVRAVIVSSAVPGCFSAGLNLRSIQHEPASVRRLLERLYIKLTQAQYTLGKPSIAAVTGSARGGGMTLAISCDVIVGSDSATFGYPEIDAGVLPAIHFTHLPRIVGRHRAFELLFSGRSFPAQEAQELGLLSRVVPEAEVMPEARRMAQVFCGKSRDVVRMGRAAFMDANDHGFRAAVASAVETFCNVAGSADAKEGMAAFIEKRKPVWPK